MAADVGFGGWSVRRYYDPGETICRQGDSGTCLYVVLSGAVVVTALSPAGREVVLGILGPGHAFGQSGLLGQSHSGTARAMCASWILGVPLGAATAQTVGLPVGSATARTLGRDGVVFALAARVEQLESWLADIGLCDVPARVARRLCELIDRHGVRENGRVALDLPITQGQLAAAVGASRETVNRCLSMLVSTGALLRRGRRYVVTDERALRAAAREA